MKRCYVTGAVVQSPELYSVYFGERVSSIRELIKRYCYSNMIVAAGSTAGSSYGYQAVLAWPVFPPFSFENVSTNFPTCARHWSWTYLTWFKMCFGAAKGGCRWRFLQHPTLYNAVPAYPLSILATRFYLASLINNSVVSTTGQYAFLEGAGGAGVAVSVANGSTATLDVEIPDTNQQKYLDARATIAYQNAWMTLIQGMYASLTSYISIWTAAADDVSLTLFVGPPTMIYRSTGT